MLKMLLYVAFFHCSDAFLLAEALDCKCSDVVIKPLTNAFTFNYF